MACINAYIRELSSRISVLLTKVGGRFKATVSNLSTPLVVRITDATKNHMSVTLSRYSKPLIASATDAVKEHLKIKCSIVCTLAEVAAYLDVTPEDISWITDDMGVYFDVQSNVEWIIVTS